MATLSSVGVTVASTNGNNGNDVSLHVHTDAVTPITPTAAASSSPAATGTGTGTSSVLQSPHTSAALAVKGSAAVGGELKEEEADTPLLDDTIIIDNGATTIRVTAFFAAVCNLFFFVNIAAMVALKGRDDTPSATQLSPTLIAFACIAGFDFLITLWDFYKCWIGTRQSHIPLTWDWHHAGFKRMLPPIVTHAALIFPTLMTFLLASQGQSGFFSLLGEGNSLADLLKLHIAAFFLVLFFGLITFVFVHYSLKYGKFGQPVVAGPGVNRRRWRITAWDVAARLVAVCSIVTEVALAASFVRAANEGESVNTGLVLFTLFYLLIGVVVLIYNLALFFRRSNPRKWWLAFRAVTAVNLFVAYICFWVTLILITLVGTSSDRSGFWTAVDRLTPKRSALIYTHLALFGFYLLVSAVRMYWSKLRKAGRQPRVFKAKAVAPASLPPPAAAAAEVKS